MHHTAILSDSFYLHWQGVIIVLPNLIYSNAMNITFILDFNVKKNVVNNFQFLCY